ncbi:nitrite reductase (NADH) small subunit [Jatrophihabitans endophyticus]|uniref:Nitrite reductase (NADH) small subunit n=1 Tax=Jatrophihabitans endophyticus TaxID=1206085 RepID=A0A1M5T2G7_9ACTN|nr:nitrite reductase small subunit NirD [Jatrophihabitans endophyticus]SHH44543.1 nitrite reductase (NADH) small subunit [Jatrophihabitans endophyticus]
MTPRGAPEWVPVCSYDRLQPERGVAALVGDRQVALFRTFDGMLYAVDNQDPYTGQFVLSRGIVGTAGDAPTVASPLFKQAFDLRTGACVGDPDVSVAAHEVRRSGDTVEVRLSS